MSFASTVAFDTAAAYRLKLSFQEVWDPRPAVAGLLPGTVVPARRRERPRPHGQGRANHPQALDRDP